MMPSVVIAPFSALEGTDMKRVTQFDIYVLGIARALSYLKEGDHLADNIDLLVMAYISLNGFCNDELSNQVLPNSVAEAKHLRAVVHTFQDAISGKAALEAYSDNGKLTKGGADITARFVASLETALQHELRDLPTYVIETIGIYDTDALLTKAAAVFAADLVPLIPAKTLDDFKRAGACLAFELYTASGFHGYRGVDAMLRTYCTHFTGDLPKQKDWGSFIQAVRNVAPGSPRMPNTRTIALIDRIRAEDRNPLIHPETDLEAQEANNAFDLCRTAITFMAMDIKNAP